MSGGFLFDHSEAVVIGVDGISDFNALHSRKHDLEVQFCAFDVLAEGGDCWRRGREKNPEILSITISGS